MAENEIILVMNAYIDVFGNLILKKFISDRKAMYLILKRALNGESIKAVIEIKNRERAKKFLDYLETTV